ncbi:MAG: Maf family protein [Tepidanaerobacteraceae bacterium]|jgi:septum formation protein
MSKEIVLASASPRRRQLLSSLGLDITVVPSCHEERITSKGVISSIVMDMAEQKAQSVADRYPDSIVIGADTIVVIDGKILGKPSAKDEAAQMLESLSGRWHSVFTGIALINMQSDTLLKDFEQSNVKFKHLSELEIKKYIETGEPMDKAGAYGIQGIGALLVEKIEGCYYNIVGLPLFKLNQMLSRFNAQIL